MAKEPWILIRSYLKAFCLKSTISAISLSSLRKTKVPIDMAGHPPSRRVVEAQRIGIRIKVSHQFLRFSVFGRGQSARIVRLRIRDARSVVRDSDRTSVFDSNQVKSPWASPRRVSAGSGVMAGPPTNAVVIPKAPICTQSVSAIALPCVDARCSVRAGLLLVPCGWLSNGARNAASDGAMPQPLIRRLCNDKSLEA